MLRIRSVFFAFVVSLVALPAICPAKDPPPEDPWLNFVPGRFVLIGRQPNGGATYAGEAQITSKGKGLVLSRTIAGKTIEAEGKSEMASPGEGKVLRFRFEDGGSWLISCLVSSDLDNYARLSCVWGREGASYKVPGLESYYSAEAWSEGE